MNDFLMDIKTAKKKRRITYDPYIQKYPGDLYRFKGTSLKRCLKKEKIQALISLLQKDF